MTSESLPIDKNARIAIIGAGPAGLSTAWFLKKKEYRNVTVLEKLGRIGGLCKSITVDGKSYDIGANYVTWAYTETLKIAKEMKATTYKEKPYTSIEVTDEGKKAGYRDLKDAVLYNPFTKEKVGYIAFMIAALRYFWLRLCLSSVIDQPDYLAKINKDTHPDLCVSFREWLGKNNLDSLASLFEFPISIMGYGQLRHIATPYALRYMSLKTFFPMVAPQLPLIGWIIGLIFPWPRRFTMGFQRLWQKVAWRLNVRLNIDIESIERNETSTEAPIVIKFKYVQQELNQIDKADATMHFDYLILACPLTDDVFKKLGLARTEGEKIFEKVKYNPYCMTTYWVNKLDMPEPIAPVLPLTKLGKPWAMAQQFNHEGINFTQFYTRPKPILVEDGIPEKSVEYWDQMDKHDLGKPYWDKIEKQVKEGVDELIYMLGGEIDPTKSHWQSYDRFTYFQHFSIDDIKNKYYEKLANLQGNDRTYYVGGVTDFELVEPIVQHSKYLVEKHFD